jgi:hypothetical protein
VEGGSTVSGTAVFTSSWLAWARTKDTALISDLEKGKYFLKKIHFQLQK